MSPKEIVRHYSNGEITVVWKPALCVHSGICFRGLPRVFDPRRRPWIETSHASTERIVAQVKDCPSGALSITPGHAQLEPEPITELANAPLAVEVTANGPLLVSGPVLVKTADGRETVLEKCALCRCGGSSKKPFCDGTHARTGFVG